MIRLAHADDVPMLRTLVQRVFAADERFELVGQAPDGCEAIRLVDEVQPDVLLLDLAMPNMDGLEVLKHFQETESGPVTIVLSGFADEMATTAIALGAAAYVNKAVDLRELPDVIVNALVARSSPTEVAEQYGL